VRLTIETFAAWRDRGNQLRDQGLCEQAIEAYRAALRSKPDDAEVRFYLGLMLRDAFQLPAALAEFQHTVRLAPGSAEAFANLGLVWNDLGNPGEAAKASRMAIHLRPDLAAAWCNLGLALQWLGQIDEAIETLRTAVRLSPQQADWHSSLLFVLNFHPTLDAATVFAEHRAWAQRYADPLMPRTGQPHDFTRDRRLKVGYVSPHFRHHAVNFFVEPILASHDRANFEVTCYADLPDAQCDATTERLRGYVDHWRPIIGQSDQQVADLVRRDQVDVLVDLSGHMGANRLLAFARKPAPVQVTYIGYQNTTGMLAMDYRLTDEWSDPTGTTDACYTEKLVRLPGSFFCYRPLSDAPAIDALPAARNGHVTFGSFNNFAKIHAGVLDAWGQILSAVPNSRLILLAGAPDVARQTVCRALERHAVADNRVEFSGMRSTDEFLKLIQRADIALDSFPFNGHTTTCDALWMGVPVVMLAGDRYASRFGSSALVTLGLRELVAESPQSYVEIATKLANDHGRLQTLRESLRSKIAASALLDHAGFTQQLEAAYRQMWVDRCGK
jgi:protein O-GlcNAc transferase